MANRWQKPLQSVVAILATLIVGTLIAQIPIFSTPLLEGLSLAEAVLYLTRIAILVLVFILARQIQEALPENGKTCSFLRAILPPLAVLVILGLGQETLLDLTLPYLSESGRNRLIVVFWLAILASGGWLVWLSYLHAPELVAGLLPLRNKLQHWQRRIRTCPACGAHLRETTPYCAYCGADLQVDTPPSTVPGGGDARDET